MSKPDQTELGNSKNWNTPCSISWKKFRPCDQFQFAIVDFLLLIVMLGALGFLLFPFAKTVVLTCVGIVGVGVSLIKEEISYLPELYCFLALVMLCGTFLCFMLLLLLFCNCTKCGTPGCKGLRKRQGYELYVLNEGALMGPYVMFKDVVAVGMESYHRNAIRNMVHRLRKLAPSNGRVVLIQRAACGCFVGELEVTRRRSVPVRGRIKK